MAETPTHPLIGMRFSHLAGGSGKVVGVFWDEQRPLGKAVLQRLSLRALLEAENGPGDPFSLERHPKEP